MKNTYKFKTKKAVKLKRIVAVKEALDKVLISILQDTERDTSLYLNSIKYK